MGRQRIGYRWAFVIRVLAIATAAVGSAVAAGFTAKALPPSLVGCWKRHVPGHGSAVPGGDYRMSIDRSGLLIVYLLGATGCSGRTDFSTTVSARGGKGQLAIATMRVSECPRPGAYNWKRFGNKLALTVAADACRTRLDTFAGVWTKTPGG